MIKQAALFVVSTGFLVYFITPTSGDDKPEPTKEETPKIATESSQAEEDAAYWGDEADDDDFVFGEPISDDVSEDDDEDYEDDSGVNVRVAASGASTYASKAPIIRKTPAPGEPGSRENPINLSPKGKRQ